MSSRAGESATRRAARARVALLRSEIARSWLARLGWLGLAVPAIGLAVAARGEGPLPPGDAASGLVRLVSVSAWACGGLVGLAAAGPAVREPSHVWLCVLSGGSPSEVRSARAFAGVETVARRLALGWGLAGVLLAAASRSWSVLLLTAGAIVFAQLVGLVLGMLAWLAGEFASPSPRLGFVLAVALPWVVERSWFGSMVSIPGGLAAAWDALSRLAVSIGGGA